MFVSLIISISYTATYHLYIQRILNYHRSQVTVELGVYKSDFLSEKLFFCDLLWLTSASQQVGIYD